MVFPNIYNRAYKTPFHKSSHIYHESNITIIDIIMISFKVTVTILYATKVVKIVCNKFMLQSYNSVADGPPGGANWNPQCKGFGHRCLTIVEERP